MPSDSCPTWKHPPRTPPPREKFRPTKPMQDGDMGRRLGLTRRGTGPGVVVSAQTEAQLDVLIPVRSSASYTWAMSVSGGLHGKEGGLGWSMGDWNSGPCSMPLMSCNSSAGHTQLPAQPSQGRQKALMPEHCGHRSFGSGCSECSRTGYF